jgi:ABC-2 type transport system ATP-binding protein
VIELVGVRKRHRRAGPWVLDGIDLQVGRGRVVQVVGTNGSGKSTLVRLVAGLARPTQGARRVVGPVTFVPEQTPAAVPMTPRVYLRHQARLQGVPTRALAGVVAATIERHRLEPVADRPLRELSKGWAQRTVIAQSLLTSPSACLLDEPFTGVDAASREHLLGVIEDHAAAGVSFVITSHEAMALHGLDRVHLVGGHLVTHDEAPNGAPDASPTAGPRSHRLVELRLLGPPADDGSLAVPPPDRVAFLAAHAAVQRADVRPDGVVSIVLDAGAGGDQLLVAAVGEGWTIERVETRRDR